MAVKCKMLPLIFMFEVGGGDVACGEGTCVVCVGEL